LTGGPEGRPAAFYARISGRVQGVGFRYSAYREAAGLGLVGWVRNLDDGDVEVLAEGESGALAAFREWLEEGPPGAWVRAVDIEKRSPTGGFAVFSIE
jgi:acylphosphatase